MEEEPLEQHPPLTTPARESESLLTASFVLDGAVKQDSAASTQGGTQDATAIPEHLGRFKIERQLGRGTFGTVYLAQDSELARWVALKVPHPEQFSSSEELEHLLAEARTAAQLTNPGIVTIYQVDRDGTRVFIVQEYIDGEDLGKFLKAKSPALTFEKSARLMAAIAEAVAFAHAKGFVHRDLKPPNILMDAQQRPRVADFGLAVHETVQRRRKGERSGTPAYMSPEQVRGETHRLDGRSDIWSLGVILYEMLTGRRPFGGDARSDLFDEILNRDPKPPRQVSDLIPAELERICLKCLSKRVTDRYPSAVDLSADLQHWLSSGQQPIATAARPTQVIPKGLRSFDEGDAGFFLELLPGPRDRDGLPESIRFWKTRIEETDADRTFAVGLVYGPSGCGKSSLVKAGLLPRLAAHVAPIYVEATAEDTEVRILKGLQKACPAIPVEASLPDVFAGLREGVWLPPGKKITIVVDQFEQWLHARTTEATEPLIRALRQCDGGKLQAIVMVRDDFWMATTRFMAAVEIELLHGKNTASVDIFDSRHARKVLLAFGRAFGALPAADNMLTADQVNFIDQAVSGLAEDDKVICVRLALFAEMMKGKPWTSSTLTEVGGTQGVGVTYLEEAFSSSAAAPTHRLHQKAARAVLKALLPEAGTDIKGQMQSHSDLLVASGYVSRPQDFDELIRILDSEIRLITPTDPEGIVTEENAVPQFETGQKYYQLTHDYLVPALRTWLTRKQAERMRGRAELRLADIAAEWGAKPNNRRLPGTWDYVGIRLLTKAATWSSKEKMVMRAATRFHSRRWGVALAAVTLLGVMTWNFISDQRNRVLQEHRREAELLVDAALLAPADAVPYAARNVEPLREYALPILRQRFEDSRADPARRLRTAVLLTQFGEPRTEYLISSIENADSHECSNVVDALNSCGDSALGPLREMIAGAESQKNWRLKARLVLTLLHLGDTATAQEMLRLDSDPLERVTLIDTVPRWHGSVARLVDLPIESTSGAFRSGIALGIGAIPKDDLSAPELDAAAQKLTLWYRDMPDSGTHNASEWALRRWQRPLPPLDVSDSASQDWHVNSIGMTMIRVPPGVSAADDGRPLPTGSELPRYWLCDREISCHTFQTFMEDPNCPENLKPANWMGADPARSPSLQHPVQRVSWIDAVLFCNWLSRREQLSECYVWDDNVWQLVPRAGGYRLPTEAEWEFACRAGTTTEFVSGDDEAFLGSYAVYLSNQTAICGSKMPNPWGLFDVHGNLYEWCQDWLIPDRERALRSGAFDYDASKARSSNRQSNRSDYRSFTIGIRVARDSQ